MSSFIIQHHYEDTARVYAADSGETNYAYVAESSVAAKKDKGSWKKKKSKNTIKYEYTNSKGKTTTYEFRNEGEYSIEEWVFYINGKRATKNDFDKIGEDKDTKFKCVIINNNIYGLHLGESGYGSSRYTCVTTFKGLYGICSGSSAGDVYDITTGKLWKKLYNDAPSIGTANCYYGSFYCPEEGKIYTFYDGNKVYKTKKAPDTVILLSTRIKQNSVGGIEPTLSFFNCANKKIKYVHIECSFYNAVGDVVKDSISNEEVFFLKMTGPFHEYSEFIGSWDIIMYNYSAKEVKINRIDIEYMDGTKATVSGNKLVEI